MKIVRHETNITTGEVREWEEDVPDGAHLTVEQGIEAAHVKAVEEANAIIVSQLRDADITIIRALVEGDTARLKAHAASQAELRKKLRPTTKE